MRNLNYVLIKELITFSANINGYLIFKNKVLEPIRKNFFKSMNASGASKLVSDPEKFLKELKSEPSKQ